jgi:hypothetical protein
MRRSVEAAESTDWSQNAQSVSIVLILIILAGSIYMWREGHLYSRAALVTIAGIILFLVYLGFFAFPSPV